MRRSLPAVCLSACLSAGLAGLAAARDYEGHMGQTVMGTDDTASMLQYGRSSGRRATRSHCHSQAVSASGPPGQAAPSPGCAKAVRACGAGGPEEKTLTVHEPELGANTLREFVLDVPAQYCTEAAAGPAPLMLFFHGQSGKAIEYAGDGGWVDRSGLRDCARENGYIGVLPQGMNDHIEGVREVNGIPSNNRIADLWTGWNVGAGGDEQICVKESDAGEGRRFTSYSCYESCVATGRCGRCNWSTCHDDVAFVKALLTHLTEEYCVDLTRIYVTGESNGGMMTHYLSQQLPRTFAAITPFYGVPVLGYLIGKQGEMVRNRDLLRETAFLTLHDKQDVLIPKAGGIGAGDWAWYYETLESVMDLWSGIHGCGPEDSPVQPPLPHLANFSCFERRACASSGQVQKCLYDGHHGQSPHLHAGGNVAFWFWNQHRRATPATWA